MARPPTSSSAVIPSSPASPILAHMSSGKQLDLSAAAATTWVSSRRTNSCTRSRSSARSEAEGGSKPLGCLEGGEEDDEAWRFRWVFGAVAATAAAGTVVARRERVCAVVLVVEVD